MTFQRSFTLTLVLAVASAVPTRADNIVETAVSAGSFNTLVSAVKAADLVETLIGPGPFTVFAPTDDAFAALGGDVEELLKPENRQTLRSILTYHVVPGRLRASDLIGETSATTVNGQRINLQASLDGIDVDNAHVIQTDISCDNGIIHVIDTVLLPSTSTLVETAQDAGQFSTLVQAVIAAGLLDTINNSSVPLTILAPTDEAFAKLGDTVTELLKPENRQQLARILTYHVIPGRVYADQALNTRRATTLAGPQVSFKLTAIGAQVNKSRILQADLEATDGVIHVIDTVLLPPDDSESGQMSVGDARQRIKGAIRKGAPMYNAGDPEGCARIYQEACQDILNNCEELPRTAMSILRRTMSNLDHISSSDSRAWALRLTMDQVYSMLRDH